MNPLSYLMRFRNYFADIFSPPSRLTPFQKACVLFPDWDIECSESGSFFEMVGRKNEYYFHFRTKKRINIDIRVDQENHDKIMMLLRYLDKNGVRLFPSGLRERLLGLC